MIALSINNWNEGRKENLKLRDIYSNFLRDIEADSISYNDNLKSLESIDSLHVQLYKIGLKNDATVVLKNPNNIRLLLYYNPIAKENDPFIANKISNNKVRKEILTYFINMKNMDEVYAELEDIIKNKMRVYLGTKKMYKLTNWFENKSNNFSIDTLTFDFIDKEDLISLSKEPEFQQLLFEASLKIDNNINILKVLIKQNAHLISVIKSELNIL